MRNEHRNIQNWIKRHYSPQFKVEVEVDKQNYLPDRERHWYQPDVLLRKRNGEVVCIIEVENDPVRKALVGATILADFSIKALKQRTKPKLVFVVYTDQGIRQMKNFKDKLEIARSYVKRLSDVEIYSEDEFKLKRL